MYLWGLVGPKGTQGCPWDSNPGAFDRLPGALPTESHKFACNGCHSNKYKLSSAQVINTSLMFFSAYTWVLCNLGQIPGYTEERRGCA
jgi:hypothetical protein